MASVIANKKRARFNEIEKRQPKNNFQLSNEATQSELISSLVSKRNEIKKLTSEVEEEKIRFLKDEIASSVGKRWLNRHVKDCECQIVELEKKVADIKFGRLLIEFDEKMKPVMRRLKQVNEMKKSIEGKIIKEEAEREVRKHLTPLNLPILLQRAAIGDMCEDCGVCMKVIASDSLLGCPNCAKTRSIPVISAPLAETEFVATPYQQKPRIIEWTEFCQAKEYAEPSTDVLESVMKYLVERRMTGLEDYIDIIAEERNKEGVFVNSENALQRLGSKIPNLKEKLLAIKAVNVRKAMQEISSFNQDERLRKFYERSPKYAAYISGFWPLRFTSAQEERIKALYSVAVPAYDKYRKPTQPNWPGGYAYFLRCLCILLGWDEFVQHFNITTGQKNVIEREEVRRKIWENELDWEFVPCTL
jgi:hypothetical protein